YGLQDIKEIFRRLKDWSLEKVNKISHTSKLKIGDELCIKHYNELVVYDRHKVKLSVKRRNNDFSYNAGGDRSQELNQSQVILELDEYAQPYNKAKSVEDLVTKIHELEAELKNTIRFDTFRDFLNEKVQRLSTVLYNHQHHEHQEPIIDPDEFVKFIETRILN
ncbi:hypothetical protein RclHR1_42580001, partial [Rhizophagus clarus]